MSKTDMITPGDGYIKTRYAELEPLRNKYRDRFREYAKVTIPSLCPEMEEGTDSIEFQNDYNTEGAKLVNSLANLYMENLFPAGRSYVKLALPTEMMQIQEQRGTSKASIEANFAMAERNHREKFTVIGARPTLMDLLKHIIVGGNSLLHLPKGGKLMNYALDEYVLARSLDGTVTEIITLDKKNLMSLDQELQAAVAAGLNLDINKEEDLRRDVDLYTYIRRNPDDSTRWLVDQAVENVNIGEQNEYTSDNLRWIPVGWQRTRREVYHRGLVEEHFGSFWTLSILSEALAIGCVTLADIKFLVSPGSLVDVATLNASPSGTFHYGEADDVNAITSDKSRDIIMIKDVIEIYKRHLGEVFMYLPSTMRDAERVTAEENRMRAAVLEKAHAGVYSGLAEDLQKPLARLVFAEMEVTGLEENGINMEITTGIDALSRGSENDKINHWMSDLVNCQNLPEPIQQRLKWEDFMKATAAGRDVDFTKIIMTETEYQNALAQTQQRQADLESQVKAAGTRPQAGPQGQTL